MTPSLHRSVMCGKKIAELIAKWIGAKTVGKTADLIDEKIEGKIGNLTGGKIVEKIDRWTDVRSTRLNVGWIIDPTQVVSCVGSIGQTMSQANMAEKAERMPA